MTDLVANLAVIGRMQLMPGILPVKLNNPDVECLVAHAFPPKIESPERGVEIDTSDCTVFTVTHRDRGELDLKLKSNVKLVFEQSLLAISEVSIWVKAGDQLGQMTSFLRQIGTTDVKAFFAQGSSEDLVGWRSPAFAFDRGAASIVAGFLSNMIVSNGPSANPIPPITRRVMSSLDLVNLGFYTESFINIFSLVDDLVQEVIKSGMTQKGLTEDDRVGMLRAIKEERLKIYLCNLSKLCGWKSLEEAEKELYKEVMKVNSTRNKIMHGSRRLQASETLGAINVLLALIDWLRSNPFGFVIPRFPLLRIAEPSFFLVPIKVGETVQEEPDVPPKKG